MQIKPNEAFDAMVTNRATRDTFWAPDSLASRPNPESKEDRPHTPNQFVKTASETVLNQDEKE